MASTASPTSTSHPYSFQRPSTTATRSLVSDTKPDAFPSTSTHDESSDSSNPTLQPQKTNNYEQAAAAAASQASSSATQGPTTAAFLPGYSNGRRGLDRQQSWNMKDLKREKMEKTLAGHGHPHGYTSTAQ